MSSLADEGFSTSVLTAAEALVHPAIAGRLADAEAILHSLNLDIRPIPLSAASSLATLRATHKIRLPDAVVLYTAITTDQRLITFDDHLAKAALQAGVICRQI
jgi:predicted nucleic acid-binding protein